jgi:hypothetical protein
VVAQLKRKPVRWTAPQGLLDVESGGLCLLSSGYVRSMPS